MQTVAKIQSDVFRYSWNLSSVHYLIHTIKMHFYYSKMTFMRILHSMHSSLPAIIPNITFDGIFLLMLGIHAKYVPWTMTNITRVDAKREFSI